MSLNELLNDVKVAMTGNRVTLVSALLSANFLYAAGNAIAYAIPELNGPLASMLKSGDCLYFAASTPFGFLGFIGLSYTRWGASTLSSYKKTKRHIESFGSLSPRFAERALKGYENLPFRSYCQSQGMYLAAKELGENDAFKRVRKEFSSCLIPNF